MKRHLALASIVSFTAFIGVPSHIHGAPSQAAAQAPQMHGEAPADASADTDTGKTMAEQRQSMMAAMNKSDARITGLLRAMNAAKGDAKTEAMAALLNALVDEHRSMREAMSGNMTGMMNMMKNMNGGKQIAPDPPK